MSTAMTLLDDSDTLLATGAAIDVRPLTTNVGAEIFGVDLREALDEGTVAQIRAALLQWKVVFFRDQELTSEQQIRFGGHFGSVTPAHPTLPGLDGQPEILSLDSRVFRQVAEALAAGGDKADAVEQLGEYAQGGWHTDVTFVHNPPLGSILRAIDVPPYGGDTHWSNLVAAYEGLSPSFRAYIDTLQAVHTNELQVGSGGAFPELKKAFEARPYRSVHPVVRVHPETGEKAIFVTPGFTRSIVGLTQSESDATLGLLFEQIAKPTYTVRFRWQANSIAFWDNRVTAHLPPTDLKGVEHDRVLQRITLAGEVPVGADGFRSESVEGGRFD
jgi:taurine dioxygenase